MWRLLLLFPVSVFAMDKACPLVLGVTPTSLVEVAAKRECQRQQDLDDEMLRISPVWLSTHPTEAKKPVHLRKVR